MAIEFPGIQCFNQNPNNDAIAVTQSGAGTATDELYGQNTAGIVFSGTVAVTDGSPTVTGTGTTFTTQLQVGQLFFIYVATVPKLMGIIQSITNNTSLVLDVNIPTGSTSTGRSYFGSEKLFRTGQSFYLRVPVINSGGGVIQMPSLNLMRSPVGSNQGEAINQSYLLLAQFSATGTPNVEGSIVPVSISARITNNIPGPSSGPVSYSTLPSYWWILVNPYINDVPALDLLPANTTFEIFMESILPELTITNNSTLRSIVVANT